MDQERLSAPLAFTRRQFITHAAGGIAVLALPGLGRGGEGESVRFGLAADCQYKDAAARGRRHYRESVGKLRACVDDLNSQALDFVVHLGDFIDGGFESFDDVLPIYDSLKAPHYHVLGNHDFAVAPSKKDAVPAKLGMPGRYYDFGAKGWRFLVLDGNDVSLIGRNSGSQEHAQAKAMHAELGQRKAANAVTWNGAIGAEQMAWIKGKLAAATAKHERVVCFCHYPIFPKNVHNLWNDDEILALLASHDCVAAYMNGHNHAGNYGAKDGVHYLTMPGMVDTPDANAYATAMDGPGRLLIAGKGRAKSREMGLRPTAGAAE